ncbi:intraflagellar transport protein 46 homolog [Chanos chanos]|uniref:Intraflagellar transport protein 46 homolog n=1 Tax=Chanos chanos TaxID=29144 RepID=A0A6J2WUY4_CHACN|nr:intraflagellar transport protein 46 homolog [Chanos chanos]
MVDLLVFLLVNQQEPATLQMQCTYTEFLPPNYVAQAGLIEDFGCSTSGTELEATEATHVTFKAIRPPCTLAYDPYNYEHPVSAEIKELFQCITQYTPQTVALDHKLIPSHYIAIQKVVSYHQVPQPDGKLDNLGLLVLDEPSTKQSDPTVLSLWLSENSKQHNVSQNMHTHTHTRIQTRNMLAQIQSVENPEKDPKVTENWIESISELHHSKPPATVHYTRRVLMPDVDTLMQDWPPEFEELRGKEEPVTLQLQYVYTDFLPPRFVSQSGLIEDFGYSTIGPEPEPTQESQIT